jgi:gamma-glutamylcyclotransferase (GGCT)/AIG2-like uncharacterized protein YtfP
MTSTEEKQFNLFVYGSLREPSILESVCGLSFTLKPSQANQAHTLFAELAILHGYRRVSPDNVYFYAIPDPAVKIEGFVIYRLPAEALQEIDRYEGKLYEREVVSVNTANGQVEAYAYLASPRSMKKKFGDRFHVNLIHELWLRKRIERFFQMHTRPGEDSMDADIERRARRILLGTTERDLVVTHLGRSAVSDYYLEQELSRPIASIKHLYGDSAVKPYFANYINLVVKQVLLNQFEWILYHRFRFELNRLSPNRRYYTRILSIIIALRMINTNRSGVDLILRRCQETLPAEGTYDLIDYVKFAVQAADTIFDARVVQSEISRIRRNLQPGLVPMGAEMELSNLGSRAVHQDAAGQDAMFDGFRYFSDFGLDVLCWKLGGYIDDHSGQPTPGKRGFLELAPGRLNILGELSKPATDDPWILNQLIRETAAFFPVKPHSLHLSFQMRRYQVGRQTVLPLSFVKCLLILGGGTQILKDGKLWISRMSHNEIRRDRSGEELIFAQTSKRRWRMDDQGPDEAIAPSLLSHVQQYKFIRLDSRANYEPLIMALKGLQLSINPGDYLTSEQLAASRRLRNEFLELKEWADHPEEISRRTKGRFLDTIYDGLMQERHRRPHHKLHYIEWAIGAIDLQIRLFNKQLAGGSGQFQTPDFLSTSSEPDSDFKASL